VGDRTDAPSTSRIELVPYDDAWPRLFEAIAVEIMDACGDYLESIHHIGSTSVPGLPAKPIIDVMPGLRSHDDGLAIVERMERLGYTYRGDFGIARRHYFTMKGGPGLDRHIHCYAVGEGQWDWHLAFRDHLRANPDDRDRYYALKVELAARYPYDVESYAIAKGDFIRGILRQYLEIDESYAAR
jgi:GrpB-like predicted nucleotidyltransferase (UPF0157 family)